MQLAIFLYLQSTSASSLSAWLHRAQGVPVSRFHGCGEGRPRHQNGEGAAGAVRARPAQRRQSGRPEVSPASLAMRLSPASSCCMLPLPSVERRCCQGNHPCIRSRSSSALCIECPLSTLVVDAARAQQYHSLLSGGNRNVRTSQGTFISRHEDPDGVLAWVEDKIALLAGIPAGHGEARFRALLPATLSSRQLCGGGGMAATA